MPRIQIDLPDSFSFVTEVTIGQPHINHGNHLDNTQLLALVSQARGLFFNALGYTDINIEGMAAFVGDMAVQYKSEGFLGEVLCIAMQPTDFGRYGFDLLYRVTEKTQQREVARGKIGVVFVNRELKKATPIPEAFLKCVQALNPA